MTSCDAAAVIKKTRRLVDEMWFMILLYYVILLLNILLNWSHKSREMSSIQWKKKIVAIFVRVKKVVANRILVYDFIIKWGPIGGAIIIMMVSHTVSHMVSNMVKPCGSLAQEDGIRMPCLLIYFFFFFFSSSLLSFILQLVLIWAGVVIEQASQAIATLEEIEQ